MTLFDVFIGVDFSGSKHTTMQKQHIAFAVAEHGLSTPVMRTDFTRSAAIGREGKQLILKAIKDYGKRIGERVRRSVIEQGLEPVPANYGAGKARDLPEFGMHTGRERPVMNGEQRTRAFGCVMGRVWLEAGVGEMGRLYCYVDPAKYMAYNTKYKLVHIKSTPSGDECC